MSLGEYIGAGSGTTKLLLHLNGNSTDSSGNGNNGTDTDITYSQANGRFGQGAGFNGSSSFIYGSNTGIPGSGDMTVSCWINPGRNAGQYQDIVVNRDKEKEFGFKWMLYQHTTDGAISFHGSAQNKTTLVPTLNKWLNVIATVSSGTLTIYLNGVNSYSTTGYTYGGGSPTKYAVGGYLSGTVKEPFLGLIDEVIIENRAWSASEVKKYYTNSRGFYATL